VPEEGSLLSPDGTAAVLSHCMSPQLFKVASSRPRVTLSRYMLECSAWCHGPQYRPPSFSVCEQAEKLEVIDHAFPLTSFTSMSASIRHKALC